MAPTRVDRPWLALLAVSLLAVGAVDVVLLELGAGYFRTGYNSPLLSSATDRTVFLALAACLDVALLLALAAPVVALMRRTRLTGGQQMVIAAAVCVGLPVTADILRYRIHRVLGDMIDVALLWELTGRSVHGSVAQMTSQAPGAVAAAIGAVLGLAVAVVLCGRLERRLGLDLPRAPAGRTVLRALGVAVVPAALVVVSTEAAAPRFAFGLEKKPSGIVLRGLLERVTDVDGDGFGAVARPRDPDPLDAGIHPFALDLPGNGIDENGLEGDHPPGYRFAGALDPEPPRLVDDGARPSLLLVFLETFRGDLLGARVDGREVTPFLNSLAAEGAGTRHAYVHTPYTGPSREQLFSGRIAFEPGDRTLYDDLRDRGYWIAHFSGQDDTHADAIERLRLDRADVFYDARDDVERRTSRTTAAVSLQVSWKTLLERVTAFLEEWDADRPLLLYVNIVDAHFPYDHAEMDDLLGAGGLDRSEIHVENAAGILAAYRNAAANVDRALHRLVRAWEESVGPEAPILVTGDHGQSFYEHGVLGHGQSLRANQTRVPFVLRGIGGTWPEPLGLADVRPLLLAQLFRAHGKDLPRAHFEPRPGRQLFQLLGPLEAPRLLGLRSLTGAEVFDLGPGRVRLVDGDPTQRSRPARDARREIVLAWEELRLRRDGTKKPR